MDPAHIRAFVGRNHSLVEEAKHEHWAKVFREQGGLATMRAGHALYEHARRVRPDLPTERDRAEDLAHHIALKSLLDRASRALTRC